MTSLKDIILEHFENSKFSITEKLIVNKNINPAQISYKKIISTIKRNIEDDINIKTKYLMINVVKDKDKEWLQISTGAYKNKSYIDEIEEYILKLIEDNFNIKCKSETHIGNTFSILNFYFDDYIINDIT